MKKCMHVMVFVFAFSLAAAFGSQPIDSPGDGGGGSIEQKWRAWSVPIDLLWWLRR